MKNRITVTVLFLIVFLSNNIYSQWLPIPTVNNPICTQAASQGGSTITTDGSGGAIIAWADQRNGNWDVYAQRIDNNGIVLWTTDGVAICTAPNAQSSIAIESDGSGGAIIVWQDFRNGSDYDIYARKINSAGIVQWTTDGVPLCTATADQTRPKIVSDGLGGAYVTWQSGSGFNIDIYAQKLSNLGTVLWSGTGAVICTAQFRQSFPTIVSDGNNGAIITWDDVRNGIDNNIYAQKLNNSGVQWTANGVAVCLASGNQSGPKIASDGSNGAIITWQDLRNGNDLDIYAQRINSSGGVVWGISDVAISTVSAYQQSPAIVSDGLGGAIITWQDFRNGDPDIYAQGVTSNGMVTWLQDGIAICTAPGYQYGAAYSSPTIVSDISHGAIITWYDHRSLTGSLDIYAQGINNSGVVTWVQDGLAICTVTNAQLAPTIVSDGSNGAIIAWMDERSVNSDIYASKIGQSIPSTGSICGMKFNDLIGNGIYDGLDAGLPNWEITLKYLNGVGGLVTETAYTDANGNYCFTNLTANTYRVFETQQPGWTQTAPSSPGTYTAILGPGQDIVNLDFGNINKSCFPNGMKAWSSLGSGTNNGTNGEVWALAVIGSDLYVGGSFTTAGGNIANHIAKWDGSSWSALISNSNNINGINGMVTALAVIGTDLYAGGWFTTAGGILAENIVKWDGSNWTALGTGLSAAGTINALAAMGDDLFATSYILDPALGGPGHLIVKWNGSNWSLFSVMNDYVSALLVDGSNLYAGGQFTTAGNVSAHRIAKWDGTNWWPLGFGTNYFIGGTGLKMMAGNLYAGGRFTYADNNPANFIARWDGSNWSPFLSGNNNGMNNSVEGLAVMGTDLYVSGSFTLAGGVAANSIAKWNGTNWSPLGSGMNNGVWRLAVMGNDLYAGGIFTTAGNASANYIAKYSCDLSTSIEDVNPISPVQLDQNYPNPFNSTSTIGYTIPKTSFVNISVYNIFGKEIKVLVNEMKEPGRHEIIFDRKEFVSGIYFYTLKTNEISVTKNMILMK